MNLAILIRVVAHVYGFSMSRDIEDQKFKKKISLRNLVKYLLNITFMTTKFYKVILSEQLFVLLLLAPFGTSSQILKLKDQKTKSSGYGLLSRK